ncbi:MAG TPA: hypothetical protein VFE24_02855 [Pirellulales bacterium]|nr:hypothetical protein [Pirellulales bacterium]
MTLNVGPPVSAKPALTPPPLPKRPGAATRINPPPRPERIATHVDVPSSQSPVPPPLSIFFGHESAIEVADEPEPAASSAAMELDEPSTLEFTTDEAPIFDEPSLAELAEHDRAALGERLAALRLEGLCQNIRYQVAAHAAPAILFLLPDEGLDLGCFWEELAEHFAQQTGQQPHLVRFDRAGQATEFGPPRDAGRSSPSQLFVGTAATALPACAQLPALAAVYLLLDLGQTTRRAIGRNLAELHRRGLQPAGCILFDSICE